MTRNRATADGVPTPLNSEYYAQRASTALIITEGTQPSDDGQGYMFTPGIYTDEQVEGWRQVIDAVHAAGGRIVIQIMHAGRIAHPDNTLQGRQPLAPSAVQPAGVMYTLGGPKPMPEPRPLTEAEIAETVADFRRAASAAIRAGADGVEIHGANGYLIQQFLSTNANQRTDSYGGSIANRIRFAVEVVAAVVEEIGAERTGLRLSPGSSFNDMVEDDVSELYGALVSALAPLNLAYLHIAHGGDDDLLRQIRNLWPTTLLVNRGGAELSARVADISNGLADVITVGSLVLANPDYVDRVRAGAELNQPDPATFYGGDHKGYTDYPALTPAA